MNEDQTDPLIGKVLNERFKVIAPLGVGGMGRVYKAIQSPLDRVVALKVLNPRYAGTKDPGFERRFFLEAAMTAKLKHPNTITVHDYGRTADGVFFIAMEYVEGITLQQLLLENGPLPWPRALRLASQICRSLREAHKMGIVHRDLKPANVMVLREETDHDMVKVLDFGLVKPFAEAQKPIDIELTQAGVLLGSPLYMAPEQARNETDPRSDIYSWGVLVYQCITGSPPFQGKESIDIIVKHIREKPTPLSQLVPDIPPEVNALVMRCLEKAPEHRFQSMEEVLEALREIGTNQSLSGAFSDPRTSSLHIARSASSSQVPMSATPHPAVTADESVEVEVPFEDTDAKVPNVSAPKAASKAGLVAGGVTLALSLGLAIAFFVVRPPEPAPPAPVPMKPMKEPARLGATQKPPPPGSVLVAFQITSVPTGAQVTQNGQVLGVTPFSVSLPAAQGGDASAELTFTLDGYQPVTMTATGQGTVEVSPTLVKRSGRPQPQPQPKRPNKPREDQPSGYKDDPYQ